MERDARRPWWRAHVLSIVVLAVLVTAGAATAGLWKVSTSPRLCNACHIMQPYVQAWKASKHAGVACVQCHYPPGLPGHAVGQVPGAVPGREVGDTYL